MQEHLGNCGAPLRDRHLLGSDRSANVVRKLVGTTRCEPRELRGNFPI
jgi:hypothetical protein